MGKNITRKEFLRGAAIGAAGVGLLGVTGVDVLSKPAKAEPAAEATAAQGYKNASSWCLASQNVTWDEEHDIVIAGYGMAGTAAYIEAVEIDPNVDVVIYDKSDEANAGGQAIASGQCVIFVQKEDIETFRTYMRNLNAPQVIPEEDFNWLTNEFATDLEWIQGALEPVGYEVGYSGGGALRWGTLLVEFPLLEGADFVGATGHFRDKNGGVPFENGGCWNGFSKAAEYRGAKPLYEHQVVSLIQDSVTKRGGRRSGEEARRLHHLCEGPQGRSAGHRRLRGQPADVPGLQRRRPHLQRGLPLRHRRRHQDADGGRRPAVAHGQPHHVLRLLPRHQGARL